MPAKDLAHSKPSVNLRFCYGSSQNQRWIPGARPYVERQEEMYQSHISQCPKPAPDQGALQVAVVLALLPRPRCQLCGSHGDCSYNCAGLCWSWFASCFSQVMLIGPLTSCFSL